MPGRDGTGPMGYGPMTGGRPGLCGDSAIPSRRGGGRGWRNQFYATGLTGWQRVAQADAQPTAPGDAAGPLARVEEKLAQVLDRLERLEPQRGTDMGRRGTGCGGRGGGSGGGQGRGQGMRQRRRDGSGRGASRGPATGADIGGPVTTAVARVGARHRRLCDSAGRRFPTAHRGAGRAARLLRAVRIVPRRLPSRRHHAA